MNLTDNTPIQYIVGKFDPVSQKTQAARDFLFCHFCNPFAPKDKLTDDAHSTGVAGEGGGGHAAPIQPLKKKAVLNASCIEIVYTPLKRRVLSGSVLHLDENDTKIVYLG